MYRQITVYYFIPCIEGYQTIKPQRYSFIISTLIGRSNKQFFKTLQTMNNELRLYLRLRVNIPHEIILLIEKYLWQLKLAPTNLTIYEFSECSGMLSNLNMSIGLFSLYVKKLGKPFPTALDLMGYWGVDHPHKYGPKCSYNRFIGTRRRRPSIIMNFPYYYTTCIRNGHYNNRVFKLSDEKHILESFSIKNV